MSIENLLVRMAGVEACPPSSKVENTGTGEVKTAKSLPPYPCPLPFSGVVEPHKNKGLTQITLLTPFLDRGASVNQNSQVGNFSATSNLKSEKIAHIENREKEIFPDGLNPAILAMDLPDDSILKSEVHRLLDFADELYRAGDRDGMVRKLDDIRRLIQKQPSSQTAQKAPRNGGVAIGEVTAATTQSLASNAKTRQNGGNPVSVRAEQSVSAPSDHAELLTERAAIREYDGGQPRDQAERDAVQEVGPCFVCGGGRFWVSTFGVIVCERCHPPATPKLVERHLSIG